MPLSAVDLARLANENEVIVVRNALANSEFVFDDPNLKITVVWGVAGDPDGEDVQEVSAVVLRNTSFRRTLAQGQLVVEEAPEALQQAIDAQRAAWDRRQLRVTEAGNLAQKASDRTIGHGVACIAPGPRGEICNSYALVMGRGQGDRPPLCAEHASLANQYAVTETDVIGPDGKPEVIWRRASLIRARG